MLRNQKGFTLIEIIAVLVILGILAAIAIPKYLSMADEARTKAAQGAIAEVKGRLSSVQAKMMMVNNGNAPTAAAILTNAATANYYGTLANLANVGSDFVVSNPTATGTGGNITITVTKVQGANTSPTTGIVGTFTAASGS